MSRAVVDWFRASALRGIPNAGWARAISESVVSRRPRAEIAIQATRSRLIRDSASINAGALEREVLDIPKLPQLMFTGMRGLHPGAHACRYALRLIRVWQPTVRPPEYMRAGGSPRCGRAQRCSGSINRGAQ